jgi:hypothetical protein
MTAFTTAQRAQIRLYVGAAAIFHQYVPIFENAITAIQAQADGGALPTDDDQQVVLSCMAQIAAIDGYIQTALMYTQVDSVDGGDATVDYMRQVFLYKQQGRRLIAQICSRLSMSGPVVDYYTGRPTSNEFGYNPFQNMNASSSYPSF